MGLIELQQTYISVFQLFIFSPLKHHRMKEWLRLTQTSGDCLNQLICSNQVQLDQVAQGCVQLGCLCRWRLHNISQQPGPVFDHLHTKTYFLMFKQNLLYFCLCLVHLVMSLDTTEKTGSAFFILSYQIFL